MSRTDDLLKIIGIGAVGIIGIIVVIFILGVMVLIVGALIYSTEPTSTTPSVTVAPVDNSATLTPENADLLLDDTTTILQDHYKYYTVVLSPDVSSEIGQVNVSVSTNGSMVDVMLLDSENFMKYITAINSTQGGTWDTFVDDKSVSDINFTFTAPDTDRYYVVIDNTRSPVGGAYAGTAVVAHTVITAD
jgi:hypothetical protein